MLLVGIVDFGMVMNAQTVIANAAREGARTGALGGTTMQTQSAVTSAIAWMPGAAKVGTSVTVTCKTPAGATCILEDATPDTGGVVTVQVQYLHTWLSPTMLGLSPTITLGAQSQMRIE